MLRECPLPEPSAVIGKPMAVVILGITSLPSTTTPSLKAKEQRFSE